MSPQPTDIQSIAGRLVTAERIQRLHDQQMLLSQQRAAVAGEYESTKGESQVADTKQTEQERIREMQRREPYGRSRRRRRRERKGGEEPEEGSNAEEGDETRQYPETGEGQHVDVTI